MTTPFGAIFEAENSTCVPSFCATFKRIEETSRLFYGGPVSFELQLKTMVLWPSSGVHVYGLAPLETQATNRFNTSRPGSVSDGLAFKACEASRAGGGGIWSHSRLANLGMGM